MRGLVANVLRTFLSRTRTIHATRATKHRAKRCLAERKLVNSVPYDRDIRVVAQSSS